MKVNFGMFRLKIRLLFNQSTDLSSSKGWGYIAPHRRFKCLNFMEKKMRKLVLATVFLAAATTAFAGGMSEPVMDPPVVVSAMDGVNSSDNGLLVPLIILALLLAVGSSGSGGTASSLL